jgi:hypothetical protein
VVIANRQDRGIDIDDLALFALGRARRKNEFRMPFLLPSGANRDGPGTNASALAISPVTAICLLPVASLRQTCTDRAWRAGHCRNPPPRRRCRECQGVAIITLVAEIDVRIARRHRRGPARPWRSAASGRRNGSISPPACHRCWLKRFQSPTFLRNGNRCSRIAIIRGAPVSPESQPPRSDRCTGGM